MEGSSIQAGAPHDTENPNPYPLLEARVMEELKLDIPSPTYPLRCIFRVPHRLRCEHGKAVHYTPQVISIGPLHHGNPALKAMEEHKKRYLQYFMARHNKLSLTHYITKIKDQEARLRSCYSEPIAFKSDEFVRIILVDAIFLIEFLFRNWHPKLLDENDCIFGIPQIVQDVWPDLLMLENQLPFFILVDLFNPAIFPVPHKYVERLSILFLSRKFLNVVPTFGGRSHDLEICSSEVRHFVDLLRKLCIAPMLKRQSEGQSKSTTESPANVGKKWSHISQRLCCHMTVAASMDTNELVRTDDFSDSDKLKSADEFSDSDELEGATVPLGLRCLLFCPLSKMCAATNRRSIKILTTAPSITELHLAGVKIKKGSTKNLFDIRFKHGILEIPKLKTEDRTELILRNLVAFEQCGVFEIRYISDYVGIMDQFVDTPKDVELLVEYKIVKNNLGGGNNALSTMINSVSTGVICSNFYRSTLYEELEKFCSSNCHKSMASLRQNYFNTPWATISFFAAVFLLILTAVQTICSIISLL